MNHPVLSSHSRRGHGTAAARQSGIATSGSPGVIDLEVVGPSEPDRLELEQYIYERYRRVYGANLQDFLPHLLALRRLDDTLIGALGYRLAADEPLFLEAYLEWPADAMLSQRLGIQIHRARIVEVGNLVSTSPGGARRLIMVLTALLKGMGLRWVIFTGTPTLLNTFSRLGIDLVRMAPAVKERVADADTCWGSYYDVHPWVVATDIRRTFHHLRSKLFVAESSSPLKALWCRAYRVGAAQGRAAPPDLPTSGREYAL